MSDKRILDKLDKIDERLNGIDKTMVKQEENLSEHMRRTALLEDAIMPLQKHVSHMEGALKLVGTLSLVVGLILGLIKLASYV